jgi:hypothetical protein
MPSVDINVMTVIAAAVVNMIIGSVWYSPALFAKQWVKLTGRKIEDMKGAGSGYVIAGIGALVQAWILAHFVQYAGASTAVKGAMIGFWLWVGFVAVTNGVNTIFAGRRKKLWAIDSGYFLAVLIVNGALLAVWS